MKNKIALFAVMMSAAAFSYADQYIAAIDMEIAIMSHPKTEMNKNVLIALKDEYEGQLEAKRDFLKKEYAKYQALVTEANSEALNEKTRKEKVTEARSLGAQLQLAEEDIRRSMSELQFKLQKKEVEFMSAIVEDISAQVKALSEQLKFDLVVDSSAMRASAPIPLIMYASDALDITDKIIEMTGGKRVEKAKSVPEAKTEEAKQ